MQHYKPTGFGGDAKARLERAKIIDKIKADWCEKNNIPLLIIPYTHFDKIEPLLDDFIKK